ncbi:hypothetical protein chiPu_0028045 [Chiloscyllium punctatum]|uniref:Uncharacterized protein n=1 Tax=Chiloscyllium punctatum TaxID=137246 RepID=A0A401TN21_CHIPU|nr:hypothetical protein [Chiloscyllium punctatum]
MGTVLAELSVPRGTVLVDGHGCRTCLHIATLTRNQTILAMLLQAGSNVNSQDGTSGKTSLHLSVECGDRALVRFLLKMGAAVNAIMYNGCSALHLAVGRWDTQTADILCQAGADPLLPNVEGDTARDLASDNIDVSEVNGKMLSAGQGWWGWGRIQEGDPGRLKEQRERERGRIQEGGPGKLKEQREREGGSRKEILGG